MRKFAIILSAALVITMGLSGTARAATVWHVQAGSLGFLPTGAPNFDGGFGNAFYPGTIAVHPGDTVSFAPVGPHVIAFNPPPSPVFTFFAPNGVTTLDTPNRFVNSGFIGFAPTPFNLTIGADLPAGRYKYFCMIHFGMTGTIAVLPRSEKLPKTDAEYTAIAQRQIARDLARAAEIASDVREDNEDEDGTPTVVVGAGDARVSNSRFFPETSTIRVGQSINFVKRDPTEPHTVTFGPPPGGNDLLPSGPPPYTYGGTGTVHSGYLLTKQQFAFFHIPPAVPLVQTTKIKVTFTAPGTYRYVCTLHDDIGMIGTVVVRP